MLVCCREKRFQANLYGAIYQESVGSSVRGNLVSRAGKKLSPNISLGSGEGFVPNMANPLIEAFKREDSPTAALGFSKQVVSPENPLGAMVYDRAYQNSPEDAIKQHLTLGQKDLNPCKPHSHKKYYIIHKREWGALDPCKPHSHKNIHL